MAEEQIYSNNQQCLDEETKQNIKNIVKKCAVNGVSEFNKVYKNEEYILVSVMVSLIEDMIENQFSEFETERMLEMAETIIHNRKDKYKAFFNKVSVSSENLTLQNNDLHIRIDNSTNPEIQEMISKGVDPTPIAQNFKSVMEQFVTNEIQNCVLVSKSESHKECPDKEYIPVSILEDIMKILVESISSRKSLNMVAIIRKVELDMLVLDYEGDKAYDILKKFDNFNNVKTIKIKSAVVTDVNKYNGDGSQNRNTSTFAGNKNSSIICRIASRNKKYEILSSRKIAKGKKGDPLPIQEEAI